MKSALIVVDLGIDSEDPQNPLNEEAERIGWILNELLAGFGRSSSRSVWSQGQCFDVLIWANSCICKGGRPGCLRTDRLRNFPENFQMEAGTSAFAGLRKDPAPYYPHRINKLELYLRFKEVERIALCGFADSGSLAATAIDAKNLFGPETFVIKDAIIRSSPEKVSRQLLKLERSGMRFITSGEIIESWRHESE